MTEETIYPDGIPTELADNPEDAATPLNNSDALRCSVGLGLTFAVLGALLVVFVL